MKTTTYMFTIIFLTLKLSVLAQNFSKDYYEYCRPSWEREVKDEEKLAVDPKIDSMIHAATGRHMWEIDVQKEKQNALFKINYCKKIMLLKGLDIDKFNDFIFIEESTIGADWSTATIKNGIVIYGNKYFTYSINLEDSNSLKENNSFLKSYIALDKKDPRSILFYLAKNNRTNEIVELAVKEMNLRQLEFDSTKQFEVTIYNNRSTKKIEICYLHEQLTDLYE